VDNKNSKVELNLSLLLESVIENNKNKTKELSVSKSKEKISSSTSLSGKSSMENLEKEVDALKR
jgi:hypothetical protein